MPVNLDNQGVSYNQVTNMKTWILLDSDSSVDLFCKAEYVTNIRPAKANQVLNLHTNAGGLAVTKQADYKNLTPTWTMPL